MYLQTPVDRKITVHSMFVGKKHSKETFKQNCIAKNYFALAEKIQYNQS